MINFKPPFKGDDVLYEITVADVYEVAESLGIPQEAVTDSVIMEVQRRLDTRLENWSLTVEDVLNERLVILSKN